MAVSDKEIVIRLKETIEFLKVESVGGVWNTPQLIAMLEDIFKEDSKVFKNKER
ncbi:MAG: hypothetical protein KGI25_02805 [Thaumarchaeota archaeon]|nr:hypothetical protein [Nitrososphaerota archaeon]